jgi:hypothetical protein
MNQLEVNECDLCLRDTFLPTCINCSKCLCGECDYSSNFVTCKDCRGAFCRDCYHRSHKCLVCRKNECQMPFGSTAHTHYRNFSQGKVCKKHYKGRETGFFLTNCCGKAAYCFGRSSGHFFYCKLCQSTNCFDCLSRFPAVQTGKECIGCLQQLYLSRTPEESLFAQCVKSLDPGRLNCWQKQHFRTLIAEHLLVAAVKC